MYQAVHGKLKVFITTLFLSSQLSCTSDTNYLVKIEILKYNLDFYFQFMKSTLFSHLTHSSHLVIILQEWLEWQLKYNLIYM